MPQSDRYAPRIVEPHSSWWVEALTQAADAHGYLLAPYVIEHLADTVAFLVEDDDTPCDRLEALKLEVVHG